MSTLRIAALASILLLGQAFAAQPTPEARYAEAAAVLDKGCGYSCSFGVDTPEEMTALKALWDATQAWTVAWLETHPDWTFEKRRTALLNWQTNNLNRVTPVDVYLLKPGLYAFFAQYGEMGNVFLVEQQSGHFAVVWDIRQADTKAFALLTSWRDPAADDMCHSRTKEKDWSLCGHLFANEIKPLQPDGKGHPRFYLNATYAQPAETTVGGQLSVWLLDGVTPRPQWAKRYAYNFEDVSWRRDGDLLKIRATDWWHTLFACGSCVGRQMDWTLRIRPDGVDDLGMTPVVPELDAFDEIAWRVFKRQNANELATPDVLAEMARSVGVEKAQLDDLDKDHALGADYFSFGMFEGYEVRKLPDGGSELCVASDDIGFHVRFVRRGDRLFAVELTQLPESDSGFCHKQAQ